MAQIGVIFQSGSINSLIHTRRPLTGQISKKQKHHIQHSSGNVTWADRSFPPLLRAPVLCSKWLISIFPLLSHTSLLYISSQRFEWAHLSVTPCDTVVMQVLARLVLTTQVKSQNVRIEILKTQPIFPSGFSVEKSLASCSFQHWKRNCRFTRAM